MFLTPYEILLIKLNEIDDEGHGYKLGFYIASEVKKIMPNGTEEEKTELAKMIRESRRKEVAEAKDKFIRALKQVSCIS